MRFILLLSFIASFLLAKPVDLSTPQTAILAYHQAIQNGDIPALKSIMVPESFDTDMQVYALSLALKDQNFHQVLKAYAQSSEAKQKVQDAVGKKLHERKTRIISHLKTYDIGKDRAMVRYLEDGKKKQLYLSKENHLWKINYKAGRRTNP